MTTKLPEFQDDVKHKEQGITGVVIAKYPIFIKDAVRFETVLDVRLGNDSVVYRTPAENWETVRTEEERLRL